MAQEEFIKLSLLNQLIKETVQGNFMEDLWLVAEVSDIRSAASGHCYLELVEKKGEKVVARIKANIWSFQYQNIVRKFHSVTGKSLEKGMNLLLLCSVGFHELYGMSLVVKDVNPDFTLGDLEKSKREILARLKLEGLLTLNSEQELALVPKRIAVISSETAAGYEDFMNQMNEVAGRYCFEIERFSAVMQGDKVATSVGAALARIAVRQNEFDSVAIIRGGGASLDLAGFDNYELAVAVANFPLPVFTGIGHERDYTVLDYVVHTRLKTPTAVAAFYIQQFDEFADHIKELKEALLYTVQRKLFQEKERTNKYRSNFSYLFQGYLNVKKNKLARNAVNLSNCVTSCLKEQQSRLAIIKTGLNTKSVFLIKQNNSDLNNTIGIFRKSVNNLLAKKNNELIRYTEHFKLLDPVNILNRGFAIVKNTKGDFVKNRTGLEVGQELSIQLQDGNVEAKVIEQKTTKK